MTPILLDWLALTGLLSSSRSHSFESVPSYDNGGIEQSCFLVPGSSCSYPYGGPPDDFSNHLHHIPDNDQKTSPMLSRLSPIDRDIGHSGCAGASPVASPLFAQASTTPAFSSIPLAWSGHVTMAAACLAYSRIYAGGIREFAHKVSSMVGTFWKPLASGFRMKGKSLSSVWTPFDQSSYGAVWYKSGIPSPGALRLVTNMLCIRHNIPSIYTETKEPPV